MNNDQIQDGLRNLEPRHFENFIYDLTVVSGFSSVVWRTPGADGGRDIEASFLRQLPTGGDLLEKWYIECKKYSNSISWPTIYNKLSSADVDGVDILCMASYPNPSPAAESKISLWNAQNKTPKIVAFRYYEYLRIDSDYRSFITEKYFGGSISNTLISTKKINMLLLNTVWQSGGAARAGNKNLKYVTAASDIAGIINFAAEGPSNPSSLNADYFDPSKDNDEFTEASSSLAFPATLVRGVAAIVLICSHAKKVLVRPVEELIEFEPVNGHTFSNIIRSYLAEICITFDVHYSIKGNLIRLGRKGE